jgi:hypothetical protein
LRKLRQERTTENERGFRLPAECPSVPLLPGPGYDESSYRAALAGLQDRSLHQLRRRLDELAARVGEIEPAGPAEKLG